MVSHLSSHNQQYLGTFPDDLILQSRVFLDAAPGLLDRVTLLHAGDGSHVGAGVPVQVPHETHLKLVAETLLVPVLAAEHPASIWVLGLVGVTVRVDSHLHGPCVLHQVPGGAQHARDELPAPRAQGLVVQLHQHWLGIRSDHQRVGVINLQHVALSHERQNY